MLTLTELIQGKVALKKHLVKISFHICFTHWSHPNKTCKEYREMHLHNCAFRIRKLDI